MGTQKKSIDEIWKQLNARPASRASGVSPGSGITMLPGITSHVVVKKPASTIEQVEINSTAAQRHVSQYDPSKAGVTSADVAQFMAQIQRLVNCLTAPDRQARRQAAVQLQTRLLDGDTANGPAPSAQLLQALMCGPLLHPFVSLLQDPVEKCRSVASELLTAVATRISDISPIMPVLMPELVKRMGHLPVVEPAEEIRLQLAELARAVVGRYACMHAWDRVQDACMAQCVRSTHAV